MMLRHTVVNWCFPPLYLIKFTGVRILIFGCNNILWASICCPLGCSCNVISSSIFICYFLFIVCFKSSSVVWWFYFHIICHPAKVCFSRVLHQEAFTLLFLMGRGSIICGWKTILVPLIEASCEHLLKALLDKLSLHFDDVPIPKIQMGERSKVGTNFTSSRLLGLEVSSPRADFNTSMTVPDPEGTDAETERA